MEILNVCGAILSIGGIFGGALTVFSNMETILKFSNFAKYISEMWAQFVEFIWGNLLYFIKLDLHVSIQFQVTMAISMVMMALGAYLYAKASKSEEKDWKISFKNIFRWNIAIAI